MNYKLKRELQHSQSKIIFNTIFFDTFKIHSIERYMGRMEISPKLVEVFIKVRTLNNQLIKKKDGNIRIRLQGEEFAIYERLIRFLSLSRYQSKSIDRENDNQDFVYFMLRLVIDNYNFNSFN